MVRKTKVPTPYESYMGFRVKPMVEKWFVYNRLTSNSELQICAYWTGEMEPMLRGAAKIGIVNLQLLHRTDR